MVSILAMLVASTTATAHHEAVPVPQKFTQQQVVKLHPVYRSKLQKQKVPVGRDLLRQGRAKDGKVVWNQVRAQFNGYYLVLHPNVVTSYKQGSDYLYEVLRQHGVRAMTEEAMEVHNLPSWARNTIRCIIHGESRYNPSARNPDSTASGLLQFLDHWAPLEQRLDPVWSMLRVIRVYKETGGFSPWSGQPHSCA